MRLGKLGWFLWNSSSRANCGNSSWAESAHARDRAYIVATGEMTVIFSAVRQWVVFEAVDSVLSLS